MPIFKDINVIKMRKNRIKIKVEIFNHVQNLKNKKIKKMKSNEMNEMKSTYKQHKINMKQRKICKKSRLSTEKK